jgi:trans-aconitate methyltransferase
VLSDVGPAEPYVEGDDLFRLLETFGRYHNATTFAEACIRRHGFRRVLSVGEGNGEYVLALARKLPDAEFVAFDLDPSRAARAERLRAFLGIPNAYFYVADALRMPFRAGAFDFVYERGVFHILPDKERHLAELERLGPAVILVTEMANGWWYLANWRVCQLIARALGGRVDLTTHRQTVAHLRRIDGYHGWRHYRDWFSRHRMIARPIWHDVFVRRSYHTQFPAALGAVSAAFGLEIRPAGDHRP